MLARSTLGRWAAAKTSTRDLPQLARFVHRTLLARNAADLPVARALSRAYTAALQSHRAYATTTAATKPTATVKRAVKAQAASKAGPKKKAAAASKTAKKPARKAAATKAKLKTRATAKAKPKKKAAPKKPAAKKRVKKVLTEEEQLKLKVRELRKVALKEPEGVSRHPPSAMNVYVAEKMKGAGDGTAGAVPDRLKAVSQAVKNLTPAEREHYNHLANEQAPVKLAQYKAWIESHTPDQIRLANNARTQLRAKLKGQNKNGNPAHTARLVDERVPKRPASGFSQFVKDRHATGDFKGIKVTDSLKMISEEWKALGAGEKKKYEDAYTAEAAEFSRLRAAQGVSIKTRSAAKA